MSVFPSFPSNPDPGDLFPDPAVAGESQFVYASDELGWVSKTVALQDPATEDPIWPGRVIHVPTTGGGG
jgi:hypothetical protein